MIYEDLLSFWIAYLLWEFLPTLSNNPFTKLSPIQVILFYLVKEFLFIFVLMVIRKKFFLKFKGSHNIIEKFSLFLVFIFYITDLSVFGLKDWFYQYYYASLFILFWFLHYYLLFRFLTLHLSYHYLRFFLGLIIPFSILIFIDETLAYFSLSFTGQFLLSLLLILIIAPYIIIKIWPVKKLNDSFLKAHLNTFLEICKISFKDYLIIPSFGGKVFTAGVLGFLPPFRYLFFSSSLLNILTIEEILAVVAHEIGHIKKNHGLLLLILLISFPILLLNSVYIFTLIFSQFFSTIEDIIEFLKSESVIYFEIGLSLFLIFLSILFFRYIFAYFLRNLEREADLYSLNLLGEARPLTGALYKIGEATGQLFHKSWHHYGLWERIEFLRFAELNPSIIKQHSRRIRIFLLIWLMSNFILMFSFFYLEGISLRKFLQILF